MGELDTPVLPVFVDPSGRRSRRVRRAAWLLIALGCLYAVLLVIFALTGVRVDAPGLPLVEKIPHIFADSPKAPSGPQPGSRVNPLVATVAPSGSPSPSAHASSSGSPSAQATASASVSASAHPHATGSPTAKPARSPTAKPTHTPSSGQSRSASAPGASHRPIKP